MMQQLSAVKRLLVGRPMRSQDMGETLLSKRIALPVFASDPLSSVAYATEEILRVLTLGALAYLYLTPWIAAAVVFLMVVVVISYRQVVHAYPEGGGSYEVVRHNLGRNASMIVAGSLMVDYVMTVAVSVAAGVDNIISAFPDLNPHRVPLALSLVAVLTLMNLRGVRESGTAFAVPTYLFLVGILGMVGLGLGQAMLGAAPAAESAHYGIHPEAVDLNALGLTFLALRAFSSGCTALTGVEAISNGVPAFKAPKARNAARTLAAMGIAAITMFAGITALAILSGVKVTENTCDLIGFVGDCAADPQRTVVAQLASAVFGSGNPLFYYVQATTALVLILAANTAFNGFPMLASILAQHNLMPRQLRNRGDRLAFSNDIIALAVVAGALLFAYQASVARLIQLYILGVFLSFALSQFGMVKHWNRALIGVASARVRRSMQLSRAMNAVGALLTSVVLVIVLVTKFTHGAYLVVIALPVLWLLMHAIERHYTTVRSELRRRDDARVLPSRTQAIVLLANLHQPAIRALSYARATRPSSITALTVQVDRAETEALSQEWGALDVPVDLKIVDAPFRDISQPIIDYITGVRRQSPRDLIAVFLPEYVVGHWWEEALHNQSARRLKYRLRLLPNVMTISVPYQLATAAGAVALERRLDEESVGRVVISEATADSTRVTLPRH
ncbi:MAG: APC family permease [Micropruina sp.]